MMFQVELRWYSTAVIGAQLSSLRRPQNDDDAVSELMTFSPDIKGEITIIMLL